MSRFSKAVKEQSKLRMAIVGPSGSGKTYSALQVASGLGGRIAVIDSEHGSASKYADRFEFDTLALTSFDPRQYVDAIREAEADGYDVLIIDSMSHAWAGKGGALELVDRFAAKSQSRNSFTAWKEVTPIQNQFIDAITACKCHVVGTMRSKMEYVLEEVQHNGKTSKIPRKVGMAPVQRDSFEYEFDIVAELDMDHNLIVSKTRCFSLADQVIPKPTPALGVSLKAWLSEGKAPVPQALPEAKVIEPPKPQPQATEAFREFAVKIKNLMEADGVESTKADRVKLATAAAAKIGLEFEQLQTCNDDQLGVVYAFAEQFRNGESVETPMEAGIPSETIPY